MKDKYTGHPRGFGFIKFEDLSGERVMWCHVVAIPDFLLFDYHVYSCAFLSREGAAAGVADVNTSGLFGNDVATSR